MTPAEAAMILTAASAVDNRIVTEVAAKEWAHALHDLSYEECLRALRAFRRRATGVYLVPGHIRELVVIERDKERLSNAWRRGLPTGAPAEPNRIREIREQFKTARTTP